MKTPRPPQHGAAFYLVIVTMAIALATVLTALHTVRGNAQRAADRDGQTLKMARQWVLQHGVQVDLDGALSTRRLGEWQAFSDLPIAPGAGADSTEPNLDGWAESVGCATRDWLPGQALRPVAVSGADARCIGQLPWRTLGLTVPSQRDEGAIPWMVMSPNLALSRASGCWKHYHPASLTAGGASGSCQDGPPYPWIRVVDERGNLLSDRVAIALIAPGPTLPGQTRQANAGPRPI
jgi:hypothetical protein